MSAEQRVIVACSYEQARNWIAVNEWRPSQCRIVVTQDDADATLAMELYPEQVVWLQHYGHDVPDGWAQRNRTVRQRIRLPDRPTDARVEAYERYVGGLKTWHVERGDSIVEIPGGGFMAVPPEGYRD